MERKKRGKHPQTTFDYRIIKRQFEFQKFPYCGLAKNANRLYTLFISANLYVLALAGRSLRGA